jgi:dUTP pyrophosphatase
MENINIKLLNENAKVPTRGSEKAAGYDLYAATTESINITPHSTVKVHTGISIELPDNTFGAIFARSGLATKKGLRPANCVGE